MKEIRRKREEQQVKTLYFILVEYLDAFFESPNPSVPKSKCSAMSYGSTAASSNNSSARTR